MTNDELTALNARRRIYQIAWVTRDLDKSLKAWVETLRVGPWKVFAFTDKTVIRGRRPARHGAVQVPDRDFVDGRCRARADPARLRADHLPAASSTRRARDSTTSRRRSKRRISIRCWSPNIRAPGHRRHPDRPVRPDFHFYLDTETRGRFHLRARQLPGPGPARHRPTRSILRQPETPRPAGPQPLDAGRRTGPVEPRSTSGPSILMASGVRLAVPAMSISASARGAPSRSSAGRAS